MNQKTKKGEVGKEQELGQEGEVGEVREEGEVGEGEGVMINCLQRRRP